MAEAAAKALRDLAYDNVSVRLGDGYGGWPECGPFDAIVVTAALGKPPPPPIEQLKVGGRLDTRQARLMPVTVKTSTHELLIRRGYKLIDDAWSSDGRLTYDHNDEATREFIVSLGKDLRSVGWETHPEILRAFRHIKSPDEVIEIEPGGADTSGHFLHHMKAG